MHTFTDNMNKNGKHARTHECSSIRNIATHPLFIQMSVHISFCCDRADTICTFPFHSQRRKFLERKTRTCNSYEKKMSCQLLCSMQFYTVNMENSKFTCVKDDHANLMYVHGWNDDDFCFPLILAILWMAESPSAWSVQLSSAVN